jgi:hypothetical protein
MAKLPEDAAVDRRRVAPQDGRVSTPAAWRISGTYFESCNCEAICPCRMVGTIPGGRSTYGICYGVLSWLVEDGFAGDVDLAGLAAALICRYDDDEPGSPWQFVLHVDAQGDERRLEALADILLGRRGGEGVLKLPWVRKASNLLAVHPSRIEIEHADGTHRLHIGDRVTLRASRPVETDDRVACGIPGYHIPGTELYADELAVEDDPFSWELEENCAFVSSFDYTSQ